MVTSQNISTVVLIDYYSANTMKINAHSKKEIINTNSVKRVY